MDGLGIRGWRRVGLGLCKVGGVGSRSNLAPWILCSAVRTISADAQTAANETESKVTYLSTADAALSCCDLRSFHWLMMNKMQRTVDLFDVIVRLA